MQEALSLAQETAMQYYDLRGDVRGRQGDTRIVPGVGTYACADGYVYAMVGVPGFGAAWPVLAEWMDREGQAADLVDEGWRSFLSAIDFRQLAALQADPEGLAETMKRFRHVDEILESFMASHTKADLYEGGQGRRLLIGPVNSPQDLLQDKQLRARAWYTEVNQPGAVAPVLFPGPPFRLSDIPWKIRRPAPRTGEHNAEIYQTLLGLSASQMETLAGVGVI